MAVLHIVSGDLWGGGEKMAVSLLSTLRSEGVPALALTFNEGLTAQRLRQAGIETLTVCERLPFPLMVAEAWRLLRGCRVRLIHSHGFKENILAAALAPLLGCPRLVSTMHGLTEPTQAGSSLKHRLAAGLNLGLLRNRFHATVAVSEFVRRALVGRLRLAPSRVRLIYNGIPVPSLNGREGPSTLTIGSAGRLYPVKDFPLLIDVAALVCQARPGVRFEVLGEGPQRREIEALIKAGGLEGAVSLPGFQADPSPFYERLAVYLNTSQHEGMPLAVLEAMAAGVPVVAPRVGGFPEVIDDGRQGFLSQGRSADELAEICIALVDDPALRQGLGEAARQRVIERFSLEAMGRGYLELYRELGGLR